MFMFCLTTLLTVFVVMAADKIVYPEYPGGITELRKYLEQNIVYPTAARQMEITGEVVVEFTVERNGTLTGINIVKGLSTELDQEALRVTRNMPSWKPGTKNGIPVRVTMTMPINFKLHKVDGYLDSSQEVKNKKSRFQRLLRGKKNEHRIPSTTVTDTVRQTPDSLAFPVD
jgi:TonB family protein